MQSRFSEITTTIMKELPRWFKMRKDKNSIGAQFLNIFGLQFEDIQFYLQYAFDNQYIDSADINQVDIIYKATLPSSLLPEDRITLVGDGMKLVQVFTLKDFLHNLNVKWLNHKEIYYHNPYFIDWERKVIYVRKAYGVTDEYPEGHIRLTMENTVGEVILETDIPLGIHHVWNFFDEFGLLLDTPRLYGERNREYKERLLDVFRHPANSTYRGLMNSLARDLGLHVKEKWQDGGVDMTLKHANIILDSIEVDGQPWPAENTYVDRSERLVLKSDLNYLGKTRDVRFVAGLEMHKFFDKRDYAFQEELYSIDRLATPMLQYYVDVITNQVPVMWGQFIWNESFWDIADVKMSGYGFIPSYNDARFLNWSKYKD